MAGLYILEGEQLNLEFIASDIRAALEGVKYLLDKENLFLTMSEPNGEGGFYRDILDIENNNQKVGRIDCTGYCEVSGLKDPFFAIEMGVK